MRVKLSFIIGSLVLILAIIQLVVAHRLATLGEVVHLCENKAVQLEQENLKMAEGISQVGSLSKISLRAEELGFVHANKVVHLTPQIPVALK